MTLSASASNATKLTSDDVARSFAIYSVFGLVLLTLYLLLRRKYVRVFYPRRALAPGKEKTEDNSYGSIDDAAAPVPAYYANSRGWIQAARDLWKLCVGSNVDRELMMDLGLDAYVFLRFQRYALTFFTIIAPLSLIILGPVYATSNPQGGGDDNTDWLVWISLSNVPTESKAQPHGIFVAPLVFVYFYTLIGLHLAIKEYRNFVDMKEDFLVSKMGPQVRSILVEGIPWDMSSNAAVRKYFEAMFPGEVAAVKIVRDEAALSKLVAAVKERRAVVTTLERAYHDATRKGGARPTVRTFKSKSPKGVNSDFHASKKARSICAPVKVDAIDHYNARLDELNARIKDMQEDIARRDAETGGTPVAKPSNIVSAASSLIERVVPLTHRASAFVTFKSILPRCVAVQTQLDVPLKLTAQPAPDPRDVSWGNLGLPPQRRCLNQWSITILDTFLILVFGALVSLVSASTSISQIRAEWKALNEFLDEHPSFEPLFQQIAPLLLVTIFSLVPPILSLLISMQRRQARSLNDRTFFAQYYFFLVIQVFLFYQISGTIFSLLEDWYKNPTEFVKLLGRSVPLNATFFLQYMLLKLLLLLPVELTRTVDLSLAFLVRPLFCGMSRTEREKKTPRCGCRTIHYPSYFWYGSRTALSMLMFTIGVCYTVMTPIMAPVAILFFALSSAVYYNQLKNVYIAEYESAGSLWPSMFNMIIVTFVLFQITMLGIFALSTAVVESVLLLPLIFCTILVGRYVSRNLGEQSSEIPLSVAAKLDSEHSSSDDPDEETLALLYEHPAMLAPAQLVPQIDQQSSV